LVLEVVKRRGMCIEFASEECREDKEIVNATIKNEGMALDLIDSKL